MTSQFPALYLEEGRACYRKLYFNRLKRIGFSAVDAKKMFKFECAVLRKYPKPYLTDPKFTDMWFINLIQPFFQRHPRTKEQILKERYLTVSELCKFIDKAEWHFWNSHERIMTEAAWQEIAQWRLRGPGAEFASRYFQMIKDATGISEESLTQLVSEQGRHLSLYKWH